MKIRVVLACVLGVAALVGAPPSAEAVGNGTAVVRCTANFPHVPWTDPVNWGQGGTCNGTAVVEAVGVDDALVPFAVAGQGAFAATFEYHEPCHVPEQPAIFLSFARGTFTGGPVAAVHGTNVTTASVTGKFTWDRIGLNPAITLSQVVVTFGDGGTSSLPGIGAGTATFVPPGNFDQTAHLLCSQPGGQLTIPVVIAADVSV